MKRLACLIPLLAALAAGAAEPDPTRVLPPGSLPDDSRLGKPRDIYKTYFPMTPPRSKAEWEERRKALRERVLVATGLWPLPEKTPLRPVVHGKIDRDKYTVEKVFFASYPGHYVSGNLYRPKGRAGKLAGVLCPHGHWNNGRFYDAGEAAAKQQIAQGAEKTMAGARYPLQARCAQLARMGCVVFHYDMVGVADSRTIPHRQGFTDAEAELRQQNFMGLQTWNSIRAFDFLLSLPDVDPKRIGVTGASGGGTQTFMLGAVDDRPTVAFPAVMVSTDMQGGCICENCSYLRIGCGNIDLAGLFAPKPLGMSGANDWTIDIETKGLPELKKLYALYGAEDKVMAKCFPQFGHNYNQVSRELMYNWFNKHLNLGQPEPVVEKPFEAVPPRDLSVYDAEHPMPSDAANAERLRQYLTEASNRQMAGLAPKNAKGLEEYRRIVGTALRVMLSADSGTVTSATTGSSTIQSSNTITITDEGVNKSKSTVTVERTARIAKLVLTAGDGQQVPGVSVTPDRWNGTAVIWVHPDGKASLMRDRNFVPAAQQILDSGAALFAPDVFLTGEFRGAKPPAVDAAFAGFTFGYNRPNLANRVCDIIKACDYGSNPKRIHLVGFGEAGPWVLLARAWLAGNDKLGNTAADLNHFRFEQVKSTADAMMLPGALKYGGLPGFAALCAPGRLCLYNTEGAAPNTVAAAAYRAAGASENLIEHREQLAPEKVIEWLLR